MYLSYFHTLCWQRVCDGNSFPALQNNFVVLIPCSSSGKGKPSRLEFTRDWVVSKVHYFSAFVLIGNKGGERAIHLGYKGHEIPLALIAKEVLVNQPPALSGAPARPPRRYCTVRSPKATSRLLPPML